MKCNKIRMLFVILVTLQLVLCTACTGQYFKVRTDTEVEIEPHPIPQPKVLVARR